MHFTAGSTFAPDSVSDWSNFAVNAVIGAATAVTLIVTVLQAQRATAREDARERLAQEDNLRLRAARQALSIWAESQWDRSSQVRVRPALHNDSDATIRDVRIHVPHVEGAEWNLPGLRGEHAMHLDWLTFAAHQTPATELRYTIEFTDIYRDRWCITYDRTVRLLHSPTFVLPGSELAT